MPELKPIDLPVTQEAGTAFAPSAVAEGFSSVQTPTGAIGFYKPPEVAPIATKTSAPAEGEVAAQGEEIKKEAEKIIPGGEEIPGVEAMKKIGEGEAKLYETRQQQLATRRQQETERINAEFQRLQEQQALQQKKEVGVTSTRLARMGGYLGEGTAGMQYEVALEQSHRQEVRDLESKRQAALQQSQQAFEDGDFRLAQQMLDTARQSEQDIYARQQDYQTEQRKIAQDKLAEQKVQQTLQKEARNFALEYNVSKPFYTVDGTNIVNARTGEYLQDTTGIDPGDVQVIKYQPKASDMAIADMADGKFLVNKRTGERLYLGDPEADIKEISVDNRVKLVNMNTGQVVADLGAVSRAPRGGGGGGRVAPKEKTKDKIENLIDYYWNMMDFSTEGKGLTREELIDKISDELEIEKETVSEMVYRRVPSYAGGEMHYD